MFLPFVSVLYIFLVSVWVHAPVLSLFCIQGWQTVFLNVICVKFVAMTVYEELKEAKDEIEKLKLKTNLLQDMKKAYAAQAHEILEAIFKVENLNQELLQKADEINGAKQINEDLTGSLNNKESTQHLSAANGKLGAECDDKFRKWKDEKRRLVLPEKKKMENQEQLMHVYRKEIESPNGCISVSTNKSLKIENNLETSRELGETNDISQKLEEENMKVEEQLKWKKEQFKHQEEEYKKLEASQEDWELEKSTLLNEISSLQFLLDYHIKKSNDLHHELQMCNQALAHEESQRKRLEDEISNLNKEKEEKCFQLMKQLELKDADLIIAQQHSNEAASLMLEESTKCQLLKEKILDMEVGFKEQLTEAYDALDRTNIELDERICERSEMEFELRIWKSLVERLKNVLEENLVMRKELQNSLLAQVDFSESLKQEKDSLVRELEEKENKIYSLRQHASQFEQEQNVMKTESFVPASGVTSEYSDTMEVRYLQIIEEKNKILEEFQKEVLRLEHESFRRQFESAVISQRNMERTNELEKEKPIHITEDKNTSTDEIMQQVTSLEQNFTGFLTSISSQLVEKLAEILHVKEACNQITAAEVLAAIEIEEKKLMIEELEDDIYDMEQKLKLQEVNWKQSEQLALDVEEEIDAKQFKLMELIDQMENKLRGSDVFLQKVKIDNRNLLETATRLSSEREYLLGFVLGLGDKMFECTTADTQLMDKLRSIVQSFENDSLGMNNKKDDELHVKKNMIVNSPTGKKKLDTFSDIRSPFKVLNS
ncbi:unnamed protein product [Sphenostylis stenocarpa]|uniref:Uncharacterized protein n=1 Tax=Sphenostylis stenocarpa TaxID=92480 RepID=A0AA86RV11_9FABA|nr:unnamed protein product [Sphenostylis stenocarpa]